MAELSNQGRKRRATVSDLPTTNSNEKRSCSKMDQKTFSLKFGDMLSSDAISNLLSPQKWFPMPEVSAGDLLITTLKDHLVAYDYVVQPSGIEAPLYLQVWAILCKFLASQAGYAGAKVAVLPVQTGGQSNPEEEDNKDIANENKNITDEITLLGYEAILSDTHVRVTGRSEFVLLRTAADSTLPVKLDLDNVVEEGRATPLLVGEVKASVNFDDQILQPLSYAMMLIRMSSAKPECMWVFLTNVNSWDFVCVERVPPSDMAVDGGAAKARYKFTRFETLTAPVYISSPDYLKLLAVLHHIIFPNEELADMPERIAASGQYLETRAMSWVDGARAKLKDMAAKEVSKLKAEFEARLKAEVEAKAEAEARLKAEVEAAKAEVEAAKAEAATAEAAKAEAEREVSRLKAEAAKAMADMQAALEKARQGGAGHSSSA